MSFNDCPICAAPITESESRVLVADEGPRYCHRKCAAQKYPGLFVEYPPPERLTESASEHKTREGDQPLPIPGGRSVFTRLRAVFMTRIDAREAIGIKRYRYSLQTFNGRNAVRDLLEELLDAQIYATQVEMEQEAKDEALRVLAEAVRFYRGLVAPGSTQTKIPAAESVDAALALAEKLESAR